MSIDLLDGIVLLTSRLFEPHPILVARGLIRKEELGIRSPRWIVLDVCVGLAAGAELAVDVSKSLLDADRTLNVNVVKLFEVLRERAGIDMRRLPRDGGDNLYMKVV